MIHPSHYIDYKKNSYFKVLEIFYPRLTEIFSLVTMKVMKKLWVHSSVRKCRNYHPH